MQIQWLLLLLFLALPVFDHLVIFRGFERRRQVDARRARRLVWLHWAAMLWLATGAIAAASVALGLPADALGLVAPGGWRLWGVIGLAFLLFGLQARSVVRLARFTGDRTRLGERLGGSGAVMPHTAAELPLWFTMSITAGFCEELLFRGFLVWVLASVLGWLAAAAVSVLVFAAGHAYQGRDGLIRSGVAAMLFTVIYWFTGSIWPGIVIHALVDILGGIMGWLILRDPAVAAPAGEAVTTA